MNEQKGTGRKSLGNQIICDPDKCTGCELCMYACSLRYAEEFGPKKSMIQVVHFHPFLHIAVACQHCDDPDCVRVCPTTALTQMESTGKIEIDKEKCTACGWCVRACPFGAMNLDADKMITFTCDLCGDAETPECVDWCPSEALEKGDLNVFRDKVCKCMDKQKLAGYAEIKRFLA